MSGKPEKEGETKDGLKRELNLVGCVSLLIGTIIGSGIFASPSSVSFYVQSPGASLLVWAGCGVIAMCCALIWLELGTAFPNTSGGEYAYLLYAFGPLPAFVYAYINVLVTRPASLCIICLTSGSYVVTAITGGQKNEEYEKLAAAIFLGNSNLVCCAHFPYQ